MPIPVSLDGQYPSTSNKVLTGGFSEINQLKDIVVNPGLILLDLGFKEVLSVLLLVAGSGLFP